MKNIIIIFLILIAGVLVTSCGSKHPGPSAPELSESLYNYIASKQGGEAAKDSFEVENFKIVSSENLGNSVDQEIVGRYEANLKTTEQLYVHGEKLSNGYLIVNPGSKSGLKTKISGRYKAKTKSATTAKISWNINFNKLDSISDNAWVGSPRAAFTYRVNRKQIPGFAIKGSPEEKQIRERIRKLIERQRNFVNSLKGTWVPSSPVIVAKSGILVHAYGNLNEVGSRCNPKEGFGLSFIIPNNFDGNRDLSTKAKIISVTGGADLQKEIPILITTNKNTETIKIRKYSGYTLKCRSKKQSSKDMFDVQSVTFSGYIAGDKMILHTIKDRYSPNNLKSKMVLRRK